MTTAATDKTADTKIGEFLKKLVYAALKDIEANWNGPRKYSPHLFLSYDTLVAGKKDAAGLTKRFNIGIDMKQYITFMFNNLINEIKNTQLVETDTTEDLIRKTADANADCYTEFMWSMTRKVKNDVGDLGPTLREAGDTTGWIRAQIIGRLPAYATKDRIILLISPLFIDFLKALSQIIAYDVCYERTIDAKIIPAEFAKRGMSQIMIDVLTSCLREKPPTKPRAAKGAKNTTAANVVTNADATTADNAATTDNAANATTDAKPSSAEDVTISDILDLV
jgi:hypothetical protein